MKAQILPPTAENLRAAGLLLKQGQVVGMPTETVYGLAGDAFNEEALTRIFSTKERPTFDPLIVHVGMDVLTQSADGILDALSQRELIDLGILSPLGRERAEKLLRRFWPGPLTLVLPKHVRVPDLISSGMSTIGLRLPRHPVAQALIREAGTPLAAPSANRFGRISPTTAVAVEAELGDRIPAILDGGACEVGLESTVLAIEPAGAAPGSVVMLRPGGISAVEIEALLEGPLLDVSFTKKSGGQGFASPGMLASHYAPRKPLLILPHALAQMSASELVGLLPVTVASSKLGVITFSGLVEDVRAHLARLGIASARVISLSEAGSLEEAARRLFSAMRELDDCMDVEFLISEPCPSREGLGHAIQDRLARASHR